jgi:hydrogenase maturation protein HypF
MPATLPSSDKLLRVHGTVQGVGFRPFVLRLATELGINGWVRNDPSGVLVRAVGEPVTLERFAEEVVSRAPEAARVTAVEWVHAGPYEPAIDGEFSIIESSAPGGETRAGVSVDLAPCADCRRELLDPNDRRSGYPFINCTQCGPRYSIIERLPYDRDRTTMRCFRMCPRCEAEYRDPRNKRFHAEPNACPQCGPRLQLSDAGGRPLATGNDALRQAAAALCGGKIVAVKGVGGFHLMADASDEVVVAELRRRKHREEKPLAVMFKDIAMLRLWADVSEAAETLLSSVRCPIVLLPRRAQPALAPSVSPGNPWVGALLPSTPLHLLLMKLVDRPVVATSANISEEPLCTDGAEAISRLSGVADLFLGHNREIARPVDDSVVRFSDSGAAIVLRRARGYAPAPLTLPGSLREPVLCVGAQMKNTIAIALGDRVVMSPHIGDLGSAPTHQVFTRTIGTLGDLCGARFAAVACDKHPGYASTHYAEGTGLRRVPVQHHLAHVLAVLLEHGHSADAVLGVAWDGTGYGEDGTVWGGEFILLRQGRAERFAHIRPFRLLGGEAAVRDARRCAISVASAMGSEASNRLAWKLGFTPAESATLHAMLALGLNSPVCTSAGRLFDAFGALLGQGRWNSFEGQIPLAVEVAARSGRRDTQALHFEVGRGAGCPGWEVDWRPAAEAVLNHERPNTSNLAFAFHKGLARALVEVARHAGVGTVALSGGCFQNALLRSLSESELLAAGFRVLAPIDLPPNDGAIAAGQALGALWNLTTVKMPAAETAVRTPMLTSSNPQ